MSKRLILEKVRKTYGSLVAVDDVSLDIEPGEFVCFLGPSGCGKTTILRMITGFETLTSGNIIYDGKVIAYHPISNTRFRNIMNKILK